MDTLPRYRAGGTWKARQIRQKGKASQTPGKTKGERCQLSPVGGLPRKAFMRSRSYKYGKAYEQWCELMSSWNK